MSDKKMYVWSDNEKRYHSGTDKPTTRAEAITAALADYPDGCYLGVQETPEPESYTPVDILERIGEQMYEEVGDVCEGWPSATTEEEADLTQRLRAVVAKWLDDTDNRPLFYTVVNVERITAKGE